MKKVFLLLMLPLFSTLSFAQNKEDAEKLVQEGTAYHDKGDYEGAIAKYDKALKKDKDNLYALAEKAMSLLSSKNNEEAINVCKIALEKHPGEEALKTVYLTYGNACDGLKQTDKSLEVYDEGLKLFPDFYQLYFNKGVTLASIKKYDEAITCFQKSSALNPKHASSHNAIARLSFVKSKKIPALLAYARFLALEPQSDRAKDNLASLQKIMKGNVEETGKKSITITLSPDLLGDTSIDGKPNENSFSTTELILAMDAALDFDKKNKKKTEVELFIRKFETICSSVKESQKANYGFYWDYYVPYFIEMKDNNFIETFAYIAFATSDDPTVGKWLDSHKAEIEKFFDWSKSFEWKVK